MAIAYIIGSQNIVTVGNWDVVKVEVLIINEPLVNDLRSLTHGSNIIIGVSLSTVRSNIFLLKVSLVAVVTS